MRSGKKASNKVSLVNIESITLDTSNPRKIIERRLYWVVFSLRYLGFLSPIYTTKSGLVLSGHQRLIGAIKLGYTKVPVVRLDVPDNRIRGVNLLFNRATNDMFDKDNFVDGLDIIEKTAEQMSVNLRPIEPGTEYPCLHNKIIDFGELIKVPGNRVVNLGTNDFKSLIIIRAFIPIVCCDGVVLNGSKRLTQLMRHGYQYGSIVEVPKDRSELAKLMLNYLSMEFDLSSQEDVLRSHAYRRKAIQIHGLSRAYTFFVYKKTISNFKGRYNENLLPNKSNKAKKLFTKVYGRTILDFGSGTGHDAGIMLEAGYNVDSWEPYCHGERGKPDIDISRNRTELFLGKLRAKKREGYDSIISSFVLNSIPYFKDRMAYLVILAALAERRSNLSSGGLDPTIVFIGTQQVHPHRVKDSRYNPNLEPNMVMGENLEEYKVQKYFHADELKKMYQVFWKDVVMKPLDYVIYAMLKLPKIPNLALLKEAIEFEFNLPFMNGDRLGCHKLAVQSFSEYLGVKL
jgi:hypothetical protein